MLIEFFGLPGAGKSSVSHHIAELLLVRGFVVDESTHVIDHGYQRPARALLKFGHVARFCALNSDQAISFCIRLRKTGQATPLDLKKELFNFLFIASLAHQARRTNRITILDQGFAQALWSVGYAARRELWLDAVLDGPWQAEIRPDLIINVRAHLTTIRHRLRRRDPHVSRLERGLEVDERPLLHGAAVARLVLRRLKSWGVPVIDIVNDNREQMADGARLVASAICSMLRDREGTLHPVLGAAQVCGRRT